MNFSKEVIAEVYVVTSFFIDIVCKDRIFTNFEIKWL